jgi:hypothetical protein
MLTKILYIVELVLEKLGKKITLTLFLNVIETIDIDKSIIEEEHFSFENSDYHYSRKRVITKLVKHEELLSLELCYGYRCIYIAYF